MYKVFIIAYIANHKCAYNVKISAARKINKNKIKNEINHFMVNEKDLPVNSLIYSPRSGKQTLFFHPM